MIELEELSAFLDGELPRDRAEQIVEAVELNPELRTHLQGYINQVAELRRLNNSVMNEAVPQRLVDVVKDAQRRSKERDR